MSRIDVNRAGSLDNQDPTKDTDGDKKPKSRRPANTAFRQQRLKAWQPILNPKSVLPLFFIVGVIFAPIGGVLLWASSQVQELAIDYSECSDKAPTVPSSSQMPGDKYTSTFKSSAMDAPFWQRNTTENTTTCTLTFSIPESMGPPVFMYYRLTNFYQNHRRYVQSMYLDQMKGKAVENKTIKGSTCEPLTIDPDTQKAYYPCGLIANSMFNDTINNPWQVGSVNGEMEYNMTNKGIAWASDKEIIKKTEYKPWEVVPPQNWREKFPNGYTEEHFPDLGQDEDFMVWMRTAALPTFSKLARRNDTTELAPGNYRLSIQDRFPVTEYGGEKWILISTRTVIGGRNPFMGIAYVVVGGTCVLLGTLFTIAHLVRPRKLGDHTYLTWNNDQDSSAIASGRDQRLGANAS
ncbi:CDC50/LEM3 family protein [Aspergillus glaucus CBS 516.65]|uniref:Cell cycle control protein n=1 Tax=Aspergillus glaucus CBS 516.65 TaxID=1160497 RepID=A0A1L9VZZ3_ASPGL|nr:hypothetical protein ASPGLDRAFT_41473 [Aspergillus glaucus CBS 516.65]OJJ89481.1 hypothetical protein ASPGLDRAFT_41473 [Aspergillus glaucus CBS 516.65]